MISAHIPRCQYVKTDGTRCGSPSLKTKRYCYFHYEVNRAVAHLDIPPLEDGNAIQLALTDLARAIVEERIALKPAALLAYILQTASANLRRVHLGVFPDRMITELPALDPYSRGLAPQPGERNRDPYPAAPASVEGQGFNPAGKNGASAPTTLPKARVSKGHPLDPSEHHVLPPPRLRASVVKAPVAPAPAPEGRSRIAQGVSPGTGEDERIPTTLPEADFSEGHGFSHAKKIGVMTSSALPTAGAQVAGTTAAPKRPPHKIGAAKASRLKDTGQPGAGSLTIRLARTGG